HLFVRSRFWLLPLYTPRSAKSWRISFSAVSNTFFIVGSLIGANPNFPLLRLPLVIGPPHRVAARSRPAEPTHSNHSRKDSGTHLLVFFTLPRAGESGGMRPGADLTGGTGHPPRLCWEGKLELTKAPRSSPLALEGQRVSRLRMRIS